MLHDILVHNTEKNVNKTVRGLRFDINRPKNVRKITNLLMLNVV